MLRVIALGWGVQSFTMTAMSALGVLPPVDVAIHADTGHERSETYEFAERWTPWLEERGVPVVTVQASAGARDILGKGRTPPLFTVCVETGKRGKLYQTCTDRWKVRPILKWMRANLEPGQAADKLIGITMDEVTRMKTSKHKIEVLRYPFIDAFDHPWKRNEVIRWLRDNHLDVPVKSSCVFCPWHGVDVWREIQLAKNGDWEKAVLVDEAIRNRRLSAGYLSYLTAKRKPISDIDFRSEEEHGQMTLWEPLESEECSGMCFL